MERGISKKDLLILSCLRRNARETLTGINRELGIPVSSTYEKLKRFKGGIVRKYTAIVDFDKLGFNCKVQVVLKVGLSQKGEVADFLIKSCNVNSVCRINNGYDFMFEGVFRCMKDLENFLELLESKFKIKEKQVYFMIEDLKKEEFLSDARTLDLLKVEVEK